MEEGHPELYIDKFRVAFFFSSQKKLIFHQFKVGSPVFSTSILGII